MQFNFQLIQTNMIVFNVNTAVKTLLLMLLVNLIILSTNIETFAIPTTKRDIGGDDGYNNINNNCITNCSVKHNICAKWCPKMMENLNVNDESLSFSMINVPVMCPEGHFVDSRGRCRKVVT